MFYDYGSDDARPPAPVDFRATWKSQEHVIYLSWRHPSSSLFAHRYLIQYRTVGGWVPMATVPGSTTSYYYWTTASLGVTYQFRLFTLDNDGVFSQSSPTVTVDTRV